MIVCEHQTAGKGRRGNAWASAPGCSLTFSLLWQFSRPSSELQGLSLAVAVACAKALERHGAHRLRLKWPNDLIIEERKLGGILVESLLRDAGAAAVIGIGLNVSNAADLSTSVGHRVADLRDAGVSGSRTLLLASLLDELAVTLRLFEKEGFAALREEWLARHAWQGCQVWLGNGSERIVQGRAMGIARDGALMLEHEGAISHHYSGELSLRPA